LRRCGGGGGKNNRTRCLAMPRFATICASSNGIYSGMKNVALAVASREKYPGSVAIFFAASRLRDGVSAKANVAGGQHLRHYSGIGSREKQSAAICPAASARRAGVLLAAKSNAGEPLSLLRLLAMAWPSPACHNTAGGISSVAVLIRQRWAYCGDACSLPVFFLACQTRRTLLGVSVCLRLQHLPSCCKTLLCCWQAMWKLKPLFSACYPISSSTIYLLMPSYSCLPSS